MNPYDFVRINWDNKPDRRPPLWHHRLTALDARVLYSGRIEVEIAAEVPIFILDPQANSNDPTKAASFVQQKRGNQVKYILPGSSLKGVLRELVETLGNGCLTLLDG